MARFEFKLPDIGEGVTEGEVVSWHVAPGDRVAEDQLMVEVMTDKATVTIGAPKAGKIAELKAEVGATVLVGEVLVVIQTGNGSSAHGGHPSKMPAKQPVASAVGDIQEALPGTGYFGQKRATAELRSDDPASSPPPPPAPVAGDHFADKPLATPATRKLARDMHIDLRQVPPSGDGGRVTKQDVLRFAGTPSPLAAAPDPQPAQAMAPVVPIRRVEGTGDEQRIPFVGVRRRIAENMSLSKNTAAHFTFVEECEVDQLMAMRNRLKPRAAERGIELSFLPFVIKAVCAALARHPELNSRLEAETNEVVMPRSAHIGVAAATDQGLVVPVVHHADQMSILQLAAEVQRLGQAAREGTLSRDDMSGSTFTVTSLGKQSGLFAVPIINYPNSGIMGIHRIKERPVVRDGQIVIGNIMLLSLSMDHRLVDGHQGAAFCYDVIEYLQEPALMLFEL